MWFDVTHSLLLFFSNSWYIYSLVRMIILTLCVLPVNFLGRCWVGNTTHSHFSHAIPSPENQKIPSFFFLSGTYSRYCYHKSVLGCLAPHTIPCTTCTHTYSTSHGLRVHRHGYRSEGLGTVCCFVYICLNPAVSLRYLYPQLNAYVWLKQKEDLVPYGSNLIGTYPSTNACCVLCLRHY